jgi:hypothetical protein
VHHIIAFTLAMEDVVHTLASAADGMVTIVEEVLMEVDVEVDGKLVGGLHQVVDTVSLVVGDRRHQAVCINLWPR